MRKINLFLPGLVIAIAILACGRPSNPVSDESALQDVTATATSVPIPTAPASLPSNLPEDDDLQALIQYANAMSPIIIAAGEILERDGEILKQSEENDQVLCDGRLAADNATLSAYINQIRGITAPPDAQEIHTLVIESGEAWDEAMLNVDEFCSTGNPLHKIPAAVKFWEAGAKIQDAGNRFWLLMMAEGVEAWVQR